MADYYERHYLKPAEYVEGRKISGLRDVERPKGFMPHFRAYFGKKKLREITYGDIYSYRTFRLQTPTKYKRPRSIADWNREAAVLRRMLNIAMREGWIHKNPFNAGEPLIVVSFERRRERIITVDEERRLLDACDSHPYRKHLKPLLVFLVDTGCRKSEALKLRWLSVCFTTRILTIEGMTTKTLKTRQVTMTARLRQELLALWEASSKEPLLALGYSLSGQEVTERLRPPERELLPRKLIQRFVEEGHGRKALPLLKLLLKRLYALL